MSKYNPNIKRLSKRLFKDVDNWYSAMNGELFLRIDELNYAFDEEIDGVGRPISFCIKGQYGRQLIYNQDSLPDPTDWSFYTNFELTWFPGESIEHIAGRFQQLLEEKDE